MTKQLLLLAFISIICLPSCEQAKTETEEQQKNYTIDTSVVAILPYETN